MPTHVEVVFGRHLTSSSVSCSERNKRANLDEAAMLTDPDNARAFENFVTLSSFKGEAAPGSHICPQELTTAAMSCYCKSKTSSACLFSFAGLLSKVTMQADLQLDLQVHVCLNRRGLQSCEGQAFPPHD